MVDLAKLRAVDVSLEVDIYGEKLNIKYRPNRYTVELVTSEGSLAEALAELVSDWDLTEGGKPVPVTVDEINRCLGIPVQRMVWRAIGQDQRPNPTSPENSDASS